MKFPNIEPGVRLGDLILTTSGPKTHDFFVGVVTNYDSLDWEFDAMFVIDNALQELVVFRRDRVIAR